MPTLLQQRELDRVESNERLRLETRQVLRAALRRRLPGRSARIFGSITQPGTFHAGSDVDIALESLPPGLSLYSLTALLEEDLGRPVDVILLDRSRLRLSILNQSELWTPLD